MIVSNRLEIEKLIYDTFKALDPTGVNSKKWKEFFSTMNNEKFAQFMKKFLNDDSENFMLDIVDFERDLKMEHCEAAAKVLNIPLMEYVFMPHVTMDKNHVVVTKEPALVGYINVKRTQQMVHKKNSMSISNKRKSSFTGQVVDKDKNARDTNIESSMLVALGADKILEELHGPRADDTVMKTQMNKSIATKGYVLLDELDNLPTNKVTLNTVNTFLLGAGIKSDLISSTYILPKVSDGLL